ncbi:MAG: hypothetical protein VXB01_13925 [Opitutae bacterium]
MPINDINGVDWSSINDINGVAASGIAKVSGIEVPSSVTDYVSTGLEHHFNASDSSSYDGTTTWTDLAGNGNMSLINGPTKASGTDYVAFDGNDDRGEIALDSTDYFYGSSTDYTFWTTMSCQAVMSFPEDGTTGYIHADAIQIVGNRNQTSPTRGMWFHFGRRGIELNLFFGSRITIEFPNTSDFQYNSSRGYYEPIPDQVYSFALTMDRSSSPHLTAYVNGSTFTPSGIEGSATQVGSISTVNGTYLNNASVRKGRTPFYVNIAQTSSGAIVSSATTGNIHELMLYSTELSASEVQQNYDAYVDRYGALN